MLSQPEMSRTPTWRSGRAAEDLVVMSLLLAGGPIFGAIWVLEWRAGMLTPWDLWLLPALAIGVVAAGLLLLWRPAWRLPVHWVCVLALNGYLVGTLQSVMRWGDPHLQWFQFGTLLHWVPMAYGFCLLALPTLPALVICGLTFLGLFGPLLAWAAAGPVPPWATEMPTYLLVVAQAHLLYLVLFTSVLVLRTQQRRTQQDADALHRLATTDMLTGLHNRRAMQQSLAEALAIGQRYARPVVAALIDVDRFKAINDALGHDAGDAVLRQVALLMRAELRGADQLGRWGGEEFLLCAPDTGLTAAHALAERLRLAVAQHDFGLGVPVTVSIGLAPCSMAIRARPCCSGPIVRSTAPRATGATGSRRMRSGWPDGRCPPGRRVPGD